MSSGSDRGCCGRPASGAAAVRNNRTGRPLRQTLAGSGRRSAGKSGGLGWHMPLFPAFKDKLGFNIGE
jgi:hypothetical protein